MKKFLALIILALFYFTGLSVVATQLVNDTDPFTTAPIVPIEVATQGRQAVVKYLLKQVDHVYVRFGGDSLVGDSADRYINHDQLRALGYRHDGSASELFNAVGMTPFSASVIKTPQGYYDVRTQIEFRGIDDRILLVGGGDLNIQEGPGQILIADTFEPYVYLQGDIIVKRSGLASGAMFVPADGHVSADIMFQGKYNNGTPFTLYDIPIRYLGEGNFIIADSQVGTIGWNLKTGEFLVGKKVATVLGTMNSSEVLVIKDPQTFDKALSEKTKNITFYRSEGKVYGRFPLIDLVNTIPIKEVIFPVIKIWGTTEVIAPRAIRMENIYTNPVVPVLNDLLPVVKGDAGFILNIPAGESTLEIKYDIEDWDADQNSFGKG